MKNYEPGNVTVSGTIVDDLDIEFSDSAVGEINVRFEAEIEAEFYRAWDYERARWDYDYNHGSATVENLKTDWAGLSDRNRAELMARIVEWFEKNTCDWQRELLKNVET